MAFNVGDKVIVGGMPGEIVKVDTSRSVPLYMVLVEQPAVRWLNEQQLTAQPGQPQTPARPAPPPAGPTS